MLTTLHLTTEEKALFEKLSGELKEGWTVEEEMGTVYESSAVLQMRAKMASFERYPAVESFVEQVKNGEKIETLDLNGLDKGILEELCFTLGARGMSVFINMLLEDVKTDKDIEGLAGLTLLRHEMLTANASVSYS